MSALVPWPPMGVLSMGFEYCHRGNVLSGPHFAPCLTLLDLDKCLAPNHNQTDRTVLKDKIPFDPQGWHQNQSKLTIGRQWEAGSRHLILLLLLATSRVLQGLALCSRHFIWQDWTEGNCRRRLAKLFSIEPSPFPCLNISMLYARIVRLNNALNILITRWQTR